MKKIVFFTGSMGRGGAERVISILSNLYAEKGWKVDIIMLLHNNSSGYLLDERVNVKSFFPEKSNMVKKLFCNIKNVHSYIKREKPDVVVSFMAQNTAISGLACLGTGVRYIASERIDPACVKRNFAYKKLIDILYAKADSVIFQTKRARDYFGAKIQKNGVIIGNPIKVACNASDNPAKKIVAVGRLTYQKNHKMLINAFKELSKLHREYILEIYGEGEERRNLSEQITLLGLEDKVFLRGNQLDIHEKIKDAQMFVLSSDFEGLSNALLEAMMMGIPCVSTDCAGSDEVIVNRENGILVPVGDEKKLTDAIIELAEDDSLRKKIVANGKVSTEQFRVVNIIDKWVKVIEGDAL